MLMYPGFRYTLQLKGRAITGELIAAGNVTWILIVDGQKRLIPTDEIVLVSHEEDEEDLNVP